MQLRFVTNKSQQPSFNICKFLHHIYLSLCWLTLAAAAVKFWQLQNNVCMFVRLLILAARSAHYIIFVVVVVVVAVVRCISFARSLTVFLSFCCWYEFLQHKHTNSIVEPAHRMTVKIYKTVRLLAPTKAHMHTHKLFALLRVLLWNSSI